MSASVPVAQALLFVVTWPPSPRRPPTQALAQLAMDRSAALLPKRRTRPAVVAGPTSSATVSAPPAHVPIMAAVFQSGLESDLRNGSPESRQQSTAATTAYFIERFEFRDCSGPRYPSAILSGIWGTPPT